MSLLGNLVTPALGVMEIAGTVAGVPYVQAASTALQGINNACTLAVFNKKKARQLSDECGLLIGVLNDHATGVAGMDIGRAADEVLAVLERVNRRSQKWANCGRFERYLKTAQIQYSLIQSYSEVKCAYEKFGFDSAMLMHKKQHSTMQMIQSQNDGVQTTLLDIVGDVRELARVVQNFQEGGDRAQLLMRAGQERMIELQNVMPQPSPFVRPGDPLPSPPASPQRTEQLQTQQALMTLQRVTGMAPEVKVLDGQITREGDMAMAGGPFSDVWEGTWLGGEKVALKCLRMINASESDHKFSKAERRFEHEILVWAKLKHENILTLYGVTNFWGSIYVVSPWQEHGNALMYTKSHPEVNPIRLLTQAAKGLAYLHAQKVFHGNMKCSNILVSAKGMACICDFGQTKVIEEITEKSISATLTTGGSARWLAPELIEEENPSITAATDIYGYGRTILELLTKQQPFAHRKRDYTVINDVVHERLMPPRPEEPEVKRWVDDEMWAIMLKSWAWEPQARPAMAGLCVEIGAIADRHDQAAIQ